MAAFNKSVLRQLLQREAQGILSPDEQRQLDDWYDKFDTDQKDLAVFKDGDHEARVKQRLLNLIMESEALKNAADKPTIYKRLLPWLSAAAIFVTIVGGAFLWKYAAKSSLQNEILLSCITQNGMLKEIQLEDGTRIWLNAGSKLRYPQHFDHSRRDVYLEGEAYFDVIHDPSKPFVVHTTRLTTSVLGTAFSVMAYKEIPVEIVVVDRGKVQVAHQSNILGFLTPNKQIEYNAHTGKSNLSDVDAASVISWKDGKLQFVNMDMQDIAARLGRWYGYSFNFEHDKIKNCRYTASFDSKIPLNQLLKVMKAISLVNYKIDDASKTVTFLGTGRSQ